MRQQIRHQLWIVLAAALVCFTNLGGATLWDEDETLYASCAREMRERGDWVVPWFNGELFRDKPPLMFWLMMGGYELFGPSEFAARFWSAVCGVGTALATYHLGRLLFRPQVGLWAGLIMTSSIIFTISARAATVDSALTLAITLAMLALVAGGLGRARPAETNSPPSYAHSSFTPESVSWLSFALTYAAVGVAALAKGPVGVLMPLGVIGLFFLVMQAPAQQTPATQSLRWTAHIGRLAAYLRRLFSPRNVATAVWQMRPITAIVVVALVALPWYVLVGLRTDGVWLREFVFKYNLGPAVKPILGHTGPVYYHLIAIIIGFFPWSVFLAPMLIEMARRIRSGHAWRDGYLLAVCWIGVIVGLWSLVAMKLPHYVLPAYPALALLAAAMLDGWSCEPAAASRRWMRSATITLIAVGVAMLVALPKVTAVFLPGEWMLGLVGLILVAGGALCLWLSERGQMPQAVTAFAVTSVVFVTAIFGFAATRVAHYQNAPEMMAELRKLDPESPQLGAYRFFRQSFTFYLGHPVSRCKDAESLRAFLMQTKRPYVLTLAKHEPEIEREFPGEFYPLMRRRRFPEPGEVVILARRQGSDVPHTAERRLGR